MSIVPAQRPVDEVLNLDGAPFSAPINDLSEAEQLLDALDVHGRIRRMSKMGEKGISNHTTEPHDRAVAHLIRAAAAGANTWFSTSVFDSSGDGKAENVIGVSSLTFDLDDAKIRGGRAGAWLLVKAISDMLGLQPRAVVDSGHGLQVHYAIDDLAAHWEAGDEETRQRWVTAFKRIHKAVRDLAAERGCTLDTTDGIERLWRFPGSTNTKPGHEPVTASLVRVNPDAESLTLEAIEAAARLMLGEEPAAPPVCQAPMTLTLDPGTYAAYERGAVQGEIARLDRLQRPWREGAGWDSTVFEVACNLFDLADSAWTALMREEAADLVRAHAPRDEAWGAAEHEAKLTSAASRVSGQGRPAPDRYSDAFTTTYPAPTTATPNPEETTVVQPEPDDTERDPLGVVDLDPVLDGTHEAPAATLLPLATGGGLLYPGETHSAFGEPGGGKSWVAVAEAARVLADGGQVAYIDFESSAAVLVSRLRALGTPEEALRERLTYARPEAPFVRWTTPPGGGAPSPTTSPGYRALLEESYDFVVLDGVTAALSLFASPSDDGDAYATWHRAVPQRIAQRTGAAVLMIDHVTKATDTRGRFAIGSQSKLALISGAAYRIDVESPLGPGRVGRLLVKRAKDRHGAVDALVPADSTTTLPTVAVWSLDARGERLAVTVTGTAQPGAASVVAAAEGDWADSDAVKAVREYLERNPDARPSRKDIEDALGIRRATTREAVDYMIRHGSIRVDGPPKARSTTPTLRLIKVGDPMPTTAVGS